MNNNYEQLYLINLALRLSGAFPARSIVAVELSNWLETVDLGFDWAPRSENLFSKGVDAQLWTELQSNLRAQSRLIPDCSSDLLGSNTAALGTYVGLNEAEQQIFELTVRTAQAGPVRYLYNILNKDARIPADDAVKYLTGLSTTLVKEALDPSGRIISSGLLEFDKPPFVGLGYLPSDRLISALMTPSGNLDDILQKLVSRVDPRSVGWEDFEHIGASRDFAFRLLQGARDGRKRGVNILIHGAPGTGKTELCKVLAHRFGGPPSCGWRDGRTWRRAHTVRATSTIAARPKITMPSGRQPHPV